MEEKIKKEILDAAREGRIVEYYYQTDNKELILEAMEINPKSVLNASDELLANDKELALKALEYDLSVYIILNYGLQIDKEIIEKMLSCAIEEMDYILKLEGKEREEEERKFNSGMSMVVTKFYEYEYQYDYTNIIDNREHAIMLMKAGGDLYPCLSEELRNDEEIFWIAHKSCNCDNGDLYESAGTELKNNKQFILKFIEKTGNPFFILDIEGLREDKEAIYKALEVSNARDMLDWIEEIDEKFKYDREFVIRAVAKDNQVLEWACEEYQKDDTILTEAMVYSAQEKERLEKRRKKARELYFSYEEQVEKNGQTQSDDE